MSAPAEPITPCRSTTGLTLGTVGLLCLGALALGMAVQVRDGLYHPWGFRWLTVALVAVLLPLIRGRQDTPAPVLRWLLAAGIALQLIQSYASPLPGSWHGPRAGATFYLLLSAATLASLLLIWTGWRATDRAGRVALLVLVAVVTAMGAWIIHATPQPHMDVWHAQTAGLEALWRGENPYRASYPLIYDTSDVYAPGVVQGGRVQQGFPYPPVTLYLDLPGYLAGDYRWSNLAAVALAAILIGFMRPGPIAPLVAGLFVLHPRLLFVLESGWTEPTMVLLLAATVFCAFRWRWLVPVMLGLLVASKQYLLFAIPAAWLLLPRPLRWKSALRMASIAVMVALVSSLPLILLDVRAFWHSAVGQAGSTALRTDALSYLALWAAHFKQTPPQWLGFAAAALISAACLWRVPTWWRDNPSMDNRLTPPASIGAAGFAYTVAAAHLVFFALGKFAFCNYYWFLSGALCCAAAALPTPGGRGADSCDEA